MTSNSSPNSKSSPSCSERPSTDVAPPQAKRSRQFLICGSFVFSTIVIGYAFSLPFRRSATPMGMPEAKHVQWDTATQALMIRVEASRRQDQAFADHKQFLAERRKQRRHKSVNLPGSQEARQHWKTAAASLQVEKSKLIKRIGDREMPGDSAIATDLQQIEKTLKDVPR